MVELKKFTAAPEQTALLAERFADALPPPPLHLHLCGDLGAGKTLWARALIAALGGGSASSPTFAWAYSYGGRMLVHHLDLFRLPQGAALPEEFLELLQEEALCLIEWPGRAAGLPAADIRLSMDFDGDREDGRRLTFFADDKRGEECLRAFAAAA